MASTTGQDMHGSAEPLRSGHPAAADATPVPPAGVVERPPDRPIAASRSQSPMHLDEPTIRRVAERLGPRSSPVWLFLRRLLHEQFLLRLRRIDFRSRHNADAVQAYCAMGPDEFRAINALQAWAGWRTIPRNLDGQLPDRPVTAVDLCSGIGESTAVLAFYCPAGSRVLGLEYNPDFVEHARSQTYPDRNGRTANVTFRAQSVLDPFCDAGGTVLPDDSIDLINACGAIGCHFDRNELATVARECARVIRVNGLATLDTGPRGADRAILADVFGSHGFTLVNQSRSCLLDRRPQLCFRKIDRRAPTHVGAPVPHRSEKANTGDRA